MCQVQRFSLERTTVHENPGKQPNWLMKELGERWNALPDKSKYEELHKDDVARWGERMQAAERARAEAACSIARPSCSICGGGGTTTGGPQDGGAVVSPHSSTAALPASWHCCTGEGTCSVSRASLA